MTVHTHEAEILAAITKLFSWRGAKPDTRIEKAMLDSAQRGPRQARSAWGIVVLSGDRMIDAQIAILKAALPYAHSDCLFEDATELALARAINWKVPA